MSHGIVYRSVRDPVWNHDNLTIDCWVKFDHIDKEVPFTASPSDLMEYGREIFERCIRGDFGPVGRKPPLMDPETTPPQPAQIPAHLVSYVDAANIENAGSSDRGNVVALGSIVEDTVMRVVFNAGLKPPGDRRLTFGQAIKLVSSHKIITADERSQLDAIREVRNRFAHRVDASLSDQSVLAICDNLYRDLGLGGVWMPAPRQRFSGVCMALMMRLHGRSGPPATG